jgi:hypothetical protein
MRRLSDAMRPGRNRAAPYRWRRRPFLAEPDVPIDEPLGVLAEIVIRVDCPLQQLVWPQRSVLYVVCFVKADMVISVVQYN